MLGIRSILSTSDNGGELAFNRNLGLLLKERHWVLNWQPQPKVSGFIIILGLGLTMESDGRQEVPSTRLNLINLCMRKTKKESRA